jgi:hypothetical protein
LEFTILCEPFDATPETAELLPGGVRITIATGRVMNVAPGPDVDKMLRAIDEDVAAGEPRPQAPLIGQPHDPETGHPLTRNPEGKGFGG